MENDFSFYSFRLLNAAATQPLNISFETTALQEDDYVELKAIGTDSSFMAKHLAADWGNIITVPVNELKQQKGKDLSLSASVYRKVSLQQQTKDGWEIIMMHSLNPVKIALSSNTP